MTRVFWLMFIMIATAVAGILVVAVLATPSLAVNAMKYIPVAAAIGTVVGAGVAFLVSKKIAAV